MRSINISFRSNFSNGELMNNTKLFNIYIQRDINSFIYIRKIDITIFVPHFYLTFKFLLRKILIDILLILNQLKIYKIY